MPTVPVSGYETDPESEEILQDPEVRTALEALVDPEDKEDLIEHLKVMRRIREGKEKTTPWEKVKEELGL